MNAQTNTPTRRALFVGFLKVGLRGFGGVLPWARRMLVEEQRWLTEREFAETLGFGQLLPGPNVVNLSIVVGTRFHGAAGAALAVGGLLLAPLVIVLALAALYARFVGVAPLRHALVGVAAVAPGLVAAAGARMAAKLERRAWPIGIAAGAFVAVAVLRLPLWAVLGVMLPVGCLCAWRFPAAGGPAPRGSEPARKQSGSREEKLP